MRKVIIGLGVRRSGSSWVHGLLSQHPEICKAKGGYHALNVSPDVFCPTKYLKKLAENAEKQHNTLVDFSVSYLYPENIANVLTNLKKFIEIYPNVHLFCILRNPSDRAASDILRGVKKGELPAGLCAEELLFFDSKVLLRGQYYVLLSPFLQKFNDILKVFVFEEAIANREKFLRGLYELCAVSNTGFLPETINQHDSPKWGYKWPWILQMEKLIVQLLYFSPRLKRFLSFIRINMLAKKLIRRKVHGFDEEVLQRLDKFYELEVMKLKSFGLIDPKVWLRNNSSK